MKVLPYAALLLGMGLLLGTALSHADEQGMSTQEGGGEKACCEMMQHGGMKHGGGGMEMHKRMEELHSHMKMMEGMKDQPQMMAR